MKIDNEFTVSVPVERAWEVLTDLAEVSLCLPGARLTNVEGDVYNGEIRVKVGPVISEYAGTAQFAEKDDAAYRAVIDAKGRDSRGAGNASAFITMQLQADGQRTLVTVGTDLKISGKIAQLGGGMMKEVSEKLMGQFAECLETKLAAPAASPVPTASAAPEATAASVTPEATAASVTPEAAAAAATAAPAPAEVPAAMAPPEPLDLMSLAGASMLKRLVPVLLVVVAIVVVVVLVLAR